jgi:hypothetical protein
MSVPGEEAQDLESDPAGSIAIFGREVEMFINDDPIGQYLVESARKDVQEAQDELLEVDPAQTEAVRKLQFKAAVANSVRIWLGEAIQNGRAAAAQLQMERDENGS